MAGYRGVLLLDGREVWSCPHLHPVGEGEGLRAVLTAAACAELVLDALRDPAAAALRADLDAFAARTARRGSGVAMAAAAVRAWAARVAAELLPRLAAGEGDG